MDRVYVESSNIRTIGYAAGTLEIEFSTGGIYQYAGVPASVHVELMQSNSIGSYFHQYIKNIYPYSQIA